MASYDGDDPVEMVIEADIDAGVEATQVWETLVMIGWVNRANPPPSKETHG